MNLYKRAASAGLLTLMLTQSVWSQTWESYIVETTAHFNKANYTAALESSRKAVLQAEKQYGKQHFYYLVSLGAQANSYAHLGQNDSARISYEHSVSLIEAQGGGTAQNLLYRTTCRDLAGVYKNMGLYALAEPIYEKTIKLYEASVGKEDKEHLSILEQLGTLYAETARPNQAITMYEQIRRVWERKFDRKDQIYTSTLDNLARVYTSAFGQYAKAEELFLQAHQLRIEGSGQESPDYAQSLQSLGQFYDLMGLPTRAETYYLQSLSVLRRLPPDQPHNYLFLQLTLANLYVSTRRFALADSLFKIVRPAYEKEYGLLNPKSINMISGLSNFYYSQQCYGEAEVSMRQNLHLEEMANGRMSVGYAICLSGLAKMYGETGQQAKADSLYQKVILILEKTVGKTNNNYMNALYCYAQLMTQLNVTKADSLLRQCQHFQVAMSKHVSQFMSESELAQTQGWLNNRFAFMASFYLAHRKQFPNAAGLLLNASLHLKGNRLQHAKSLRQQIAARNDTTLLRLLNRWQTYKQQIGFYEQHPSQAQHVNLAEKREQANQLEKELIRRTRDLQPNQEEPNWTNVQQRLKPDEAAIEFIRFQHYEGFINTDSVHYAALVIRSDALEPFLIPLISERKLLAILNKYGIRKGNLYALRGSEIISNRKAIDGQTLYRLIWQPMALQLGGIKKIHFSPSGLIHQIAIAALPLPDGSRLADRYDLYQHVSLRELGQPSPQTQPSDWRVVAFGGVAYRGDSLTWQQAVYHDTVNQDEVGIEQDKAVAHSRSLAHAGTQQPLAYLPGTRREVEAIRSIWTARARQVQILVDYKASEEAFKALDKRAAPAVIHLATHGFFFSAPKPTDGSSARYTEVDILRGTEDPLLRSGLLLAGADRCWRGGQPIKGLEDGILTAYEIAQMDLSLTELVVLSACESGLGDIVESEGVYGLQRAFKLAGVKSMILSLWKVPDRETAEFMTTFYQAWQPGTSVAWAFAQAQRIMRRRYSADPHKWAAFTLIK